MLTAVKTIIVVSWTIPSMSWIKYYTLTSTCLYLLSFNLAPVWCYLSRQTVFFFSLSLSASRAALRNVCLTEPPWLLGCCLDRIILLWTCEEILPSVWEIFRLADCIWGGGAVQGKRGLSRRFRTQIFHPASVYFSKIPPHRVITEYWRSCQPWFTSF